MLDEPNTLTVEPFSLAFELKSLKNEPKTLALEAQLLFTQSYLYPSQGRQNRYSKLLGEFEFRSTRRVLSKTETLIFD